MEAKEIKKIRQYEKKFSRRNYHGSRNPGFVIVPGTIPIMLSAPHAVSQVREGASKKADKYTGAIAMLVQKMTGCHLIYSSGFTGGDPNYDELESSPYQSALLEFVKANDIKLVIDLHGAASTRPYAVEMGTAPAQDDAGNIIGDENPSLKGHLFISKLIRYSFEFALRNLAGTVPKEIWLNKIFDAGGQNTITKSVSTNSDSAAIQLEINRQYRDIQNPDAMLALIEGLKLAINTLAKASWDAEYIDAFKLAQSKTPLPQDKAEFPVTTSVIRDGGIAMLDSFAGIKEQVRIKASPISDDGEHIYLTKRLIRNVFCMEWNSDLLKDAPLLVSSREKCSREFKIGITTAVQLDRVYLTSKLYRRLAPLAGNNQFIAYNKLTDSRLYFDFSEETDYRDGERGKGEELPEKVMLPRYFKQLLGYMDHPFIRIRKEEFNHIPTEIKEKLNSRFMAICNALADENGHAPAPNSIDRHILNEDESYSDAVERITMAGKEQYFEDKARELFSRLQCCYDPVSSNPIYERKKDADSTNLSDADDIFKDFGYYDSVEILVTPKSEKKASFISKAKQAYERSIDWGLTKIIGKSEHLLTTTWTIDTDDKNSVGRLSPNIMSLVGISDNDKVVIKYGEKSAVIRILSNPGMSDYEIGIPANVRTILNMYSVNDVVVVSRDMRHTFQRNSQAQTIAILGTVLAVFQVIERLWVGVILCLVFIPLIIYFALNEERIKVK